MRQLVARARASKSVRRSVGVFAGIIVLGLVATIVAAYALPLPQRLYMRDSTVVEFRDGEAGYVFLSQDDKWRVPVRLDEVDPAFVKALLRFEDKRFYQHLGVDPVAIGRAAMLNLTTGRRVSGASTITMQLVRLLEPRERTYSSKITEAFRAFQLELHLSKAEILEAYLRFAPYGRNVEGIEAASMAYFGQRANALTPSQIATLLAVPQSPTRRYPRRSNLETLTQARNDIAGRLLDEGLLPRGTGEGSLSPEQVRDLVVSAPPPSDLIRFPREMPHVALWVQRRHPDANRIRTTIDRGAQEIAEHTMARWRDEIWQRDIDHGVAVLVDHTNGEIRALVGGFDFDATRPGSQIAAFDVPRSPGSLMKSFIYTMAIDRGIAHPRYLVPDIPMQAGTYAPENYDGKFAGLVRMENALSRSLNVPFVHLLAELGLDSFLAVIGHMGAANLNPAPGHYGLSAAIGGLEVTPLEVAGMYATLANDGVFNEPTIVPREDAVTWPVFTPESAYLTRRTLEIRDRPDFTGRRRFNPDVGRIHWKTGTSYGHRDAWAAGSGRHYTGVIWLGNLDHRPSNALVGAQRSGPILFDMLEAAEFGDVETEPRPDGLTRVDVCAYSGHLPGLACTKTTSVWAPVQSVPAKKCPYHTTVDIDGETGLALTAECRGGRDFEAQSFVVWPASVRRFISRRMRTTHRVPEMMPGCDEGTRGTPPVIVNPPYGQRVVLMPGIDASDQEVPLEADASHASSTLSWFVDGEFVGSATAQEQVWWTPTVGRHEVVVSDASGRSARRELVVDSTTAHATR